MAGGALHRSGGARAASALLILACALGGATAMYTANRTMYDASGKPITMHGLHIFGLNTQDHAAGLSWGTLGQPSEIGDWKTVIWRIKQLGFNAIRLPFNFYFEEQPMRDYTYNCEVISEADLIAGLTPPGRETDGFGISELPPEVPGGVCNADMPKDSYMERLIWTICYLTSQGMYVVIDHHLDYSLKFQTGAPLNDVNQFAAKYFDLVTQLVERNCTRDKLIIDFINEPDAYGFSWTGPHRFPGNVSLDEFYRTLLQVAFPACPDCLYFIEGTDQYYWPLMANWGDGFSTLPEIEAYSEAYFASGKSNGPISSAAAFFNWLVTSPYLSQVVVSPHIYCPRVTNQKTHFAGPQQWRRLTDTFGYLDNEGFVDGDGTAHTFPIVIGELGTGFGDAKEKACFSSTAQYLYNLGEAGTTGMVTESWMAEAFTDGRPLPHYSGKHEPFDSWFWWVWNPDSDDTGGMVEKDRKTIVWYKVDALSGDNAEMPGAGMRLQPWYKPSLPQLVPSDPTTTATPPANVTDPPANVTDPPANVTVTPPANVTITPPANVTEPPANVTEPPANVTEPPANVTVTPPANVTTPPPEVPATTPPPEVPTGEDPESLIAARAAAGAVRFGAGTTPLMQTFPSYVVVP